MEQREGYLLCAICIYGSVPSVRGGSGPDLPQPQATWAQVSPHSLWLGVGGYLIERDLRGGFSLEHTGSASAWLGGGGDGKG